MQYFLQFRTWCKFFRNFDIIFYENGIAIVCGNCIFTGKFVFSLESTSVIGSE